MASRELAIGRDPTDRTWGAAAVARRHQWTLLPSTVVHPALP